MPKFSKKSAEKLSQLDTDLQKVLQVAIEHGPDFTILTGHRTEAAQEEAFRKGNSKVHWPNGKHNSNPSTAVDLAPYPIDWKNINRFRRLCSYIQGVAAAMGVELRWGGDWDRDWSEQDEKGLRDFGHLEIFGKRIPPVGADVEDGDLDLMAIRKALLDSPTANLGHVMAPIAELLKRVARLENARRAKP